MKKICVIDGSVGIDCDFKGELDRFQEKFDISYFKLEDLDIHSCVGCWDCWLKTPGLCIFKDNHEQILESYIMADEVVFISNIKTGFITSKLKLAMDRLIPVVLPYIRVYEGEMHHYPRYKSLPNVHVLLYRNNEANQDVTKLIEDYFDRVALNMNAVVLSFTETLSVGGISDVLSHC